MTKSPDLSSLSRLFSSAVFKEMATHGQSPLFAQLLMQSALSCRQALSTVADAFEAAFDVLKGVGNRDEYIYKAALTHKVLLGTHSLRTASMLTEFRVENCKADLVILNGTATVYEIKSERDSLARLERQLLAYRKVFPKTYVIASEGHIAGVERIAPSEVGLLCLTKRNRISSIRPAQAAPDYLCAATLFESLRLSESSAILKSFGAEIPVVPNTMIFDALKEIWCTFDPIRLQSEMVQTLKKSRSLANLRGLVDELPPSLHAAALSIPVQRRNHAKLVEAVNTPIDRALLWT